MNHNVALTDSHSHDSTSTLRTIVAGVQCKRCVCVNHIDFSMAVKCTCSFEKAFLTTVCLRAFCSRVYDLKPKLWTQSNESVTIHKPFQLFLSKFDLIIVTEPLLERMCTVGGYWMQPKIIRCANKQYNSSAIPYSNIVDTAVDILKGEGEEG